MEDNERLALERLLGCAHSVIGERIADKHPGPHDDAAAEYNEEELISAARKFVFETRNQAIIVPQGPGWRISFHDAEGKKL